MIVAALTKLGILADPFAVEAATDRDRAIQTKVHRMLLVSAGVSRTTSSLVTRGARPCSSAPRKPKSQCSAVTSGGAFAPVCLREVLYRQVAVGRDRHTR